MKHSRVLPVLAALLLVLLLGPVGNRAGAAPAPAPKSVSVFPRAGDREASPTTTISFRGVAPAAIGSITAHGAVSGDHDGSWVSHSDLQGASFQPNASFAPGEVVTVKTHLPIVDATDGTFTFTVARPSSVEAVEHPTDDVAGVIGGASATPGAASAAAIPPDRTYHSRPDIRFQPWTMTLNKPGVLPGLIAVTPRSPTRNGPQIIDNRGDLVWDREAPLTGNESFDTDLKVIDYKGHNDLAYWQGQFGGGFGGGRYIVVDDTYTNVGEIRAGNGYSADLHDLQITPQQTALLLVYNAVKMDLTPYGGPADGTVLELVVQEVDLNTNAVLFEWHSLDDVPVTKSLVSANATPQFAWDYMHGNAVALDNDGKLLVSGRHTSNVYKISRATGHVVWTLGRGGDFASSFPSSDWFANQHDIRRRSDGTLSVFDNGSGAGPDTRQYSRGTVLSVNEVNRTASIVRTLRPPVDVKASSQGDFRELASGNDIIGWGQVPEITEYHNDQPVLDLQSPIGSYRAVLIAWHGHPTQPPDLAVERDGALAHAWVSWNGATEVASWVMRVGPDAGHLTTAATVPKSGFETEITTTTTDPTIVLEAHDVHGTLLGQATQVYTHNAGYWLLRSDGGVRAVGAALTYGSATLRSPQQPAVGIATAAGGGYWVAQSDGNVLPVKTADFGSMGCRSLAAPIVGIASMPDGKGYWLVGADGGVFRFGSARFYGSLGGKRLTRPIVGIVARPDGTGYWLVGSDGGVFTFGSAPFKGSLGNRHLNAPITGMAADPAGDGYWLVGADGGVFTFGTARFAGSLGAHPPPAPIIAIARTGDGRGYWLAGIDGTISSFGTAVNRGTGPSTFAPLTGIAGA